MPQVVIPVVFALFVLVAWVIGTYNRFIKYRNLIEESWSGIDVALKRRFNLIPNLIRAVEGYGRHEEKMIAGVGKSRRPAGSDVVHRVEEESQITQSLGGLLALAEAYPDLKASNNFLDLQNSLDEIEADIQKSRNRFNRFVSRFNILVESFPSKLLAAKFGFTKQNYFRLELATQRELPEIDFSPENEGPAAADEAKSGP